MNKNTLIAINKWTALSWNNSLSRHVKINDSSYDSSSYHNSKHVQDEASGEEGNRSLRNKSLVMVKKRKKGYGRNTDCVWVIMYKGGWMKKMWFCHRRYWPCTAKKKKIGTLPSCRLIHKTADGTTGVEWRTKKTAQVQRRFLLTRPRDVEKHNQVDLWITVRVWRQSCGRPGGNKEGTGEKRKRRDKERERIPPVLTSAPETRNGCKPVLKKGREVWEGELEGSQKAYLKDLSCMVT